MIDYTLKNKVDATFKMMDDIYNSDPLLTQATGMTCREMLKYNLLQFVGFLFESDGTDGRLELDFIRDYLGTIMSIGQFLNFKYGKCMDNNFINTPPRVLLYTAKYDMSGGVKASTGRPISKEVVELFKDLGTAFIAINDETVTEVANLSNYGLMLDNFLKQYGLYFTDGISNKKNSKSKNYRKDTKSNTPNKAGVIKQNAAAEEDLELEPEETLEQLMEELNTLVGLKSVKQDLTNLINLVKIRKLREERGMKQPDITLHLVFSGNPGTGKTTVARLLAKIYKVLGVVSEGQLVEVDRSGLVAGYVGQTATQTAEVVESAIGGILFIDEAYTLIKGGDEKDFGQEAVDTLLKLMEDNRDDLIVIVAGYTDKMEEFVNSNPGLKSRFNKYIFFNDYSGSELTEIFNNMAKKQEYDTDKEAGAFVEDYLTKKATAHEENFANAREARNYLERCIERQATRIVEIENISDDDLRTLTLPDVSE
ncbi:MAG: AAA family ATPase [Eubacterium sp.]|jgi:SpoVK/Ycf46/Vps4 family AAA+-type ATPase|nr:AAA family ATPase [Eubacterium sp.]